MKIIRKFVRKRLVLLKENLSSYPHFASWVRKLFVRYPELKHFLKRNFFMVQTDVSFLEEQEDGSLEFRKKVIAKRTIEESAQKLRKYTFRE
jgi:hypothetical protein